MKHVIQYQGDQNTLAWKYPNQKMTSNTHVIVHESQVAIFVSNGQLCDVLEAGEHQLNEMSIPLLRRLGKKDPTGETTYTAEVWYFNKACILNINWGTQTPIQLYDQRLGSVKVRSHGRFGVQVVDAKTFLSKVLGTMPTFRQQDVVAMLQGNYIEKIKSGIAAYVVRRNIAVQQLNAYLEEIAEGVKEKLEAESAEYGVHVQNFFINDISVMHDETLKGDATPQQAPAAPQAAKKPVCADCGRELPEESRFCLYCGKKLRPCPQCGRDLTANAQVCPDCGYTFPVICPKCGFEASVPGGASFCPKCGEKLTAE